MAKINGITLDAVTSEVPQYDADVTAYPVENGDISDNVHNRPVGVSFEALISDATLGLEGERAGSGTPSEVVRDKLLALRASRVPFTYEGTGGLYTRLVFEALSFPRDVATGYSLRISATLREVDTRELVRVAARRKEYRPAKNLDYQKVWLCPYEEGAFLGIAGSKSAIPVISASENRKAGCREVKMTGGQWVFKDTGKPLSARDVREMKMQNLERLASNLRERGLLSDEPLYPPSIPIKSASDKAITYAPGEKAISHLTEGAIWAPNNGGY